VNALHESDTIINFNYDLLVDQELITHVDGDDQEWESLLSGTYIVTLRTSQSLRHQIIELVS